ncbi:HtaA domain-containing protein [Corynebacterium diphtheriae]|uniref:HtaA domain-containing protein n=1 Tax=Corynebacterium diphtheriae TaxID=1717 RepID=UPI00123F990B|nr:HtaA domain-containing protein [Corynebacterium diphtheriae]MBG9228101.1 HtaA domain-containing protein [Corynebacterium diphtheriae bv. gravis]MBG9250757.1 HtaA domain-containing protein [Corynebacterium diphtheriae bv. mitis]MBG9254926.1 HtaA domain-containing protein [Corynebacterium diphtheriae bv. mitis]MBG9261739.1 HtaA domain-containing protein [Corynebacterium diphtheriae bv. mitis]MBG9268492.1 HtaA domain-containing protein [Corynebacterium diphtheriae bv. mitis]
MASVQRSRFTHLLTTATIAALLPLAPVTAAAEDVEKPVTIATSGKLNWGIRESFNNYTNGASKVEDGATRISTNNFEFKLEKATYDAAKERTEAQFRGKIVYLKYCDDMKTFTNCKLDLTIKDPKIVISNEENYVEAVVDSKQYPSGEWYNSNGPVKIANLYPGSATVDNKDNSTEWTNVVSALANPGGVKMFSEFYGENEGLAPLSFSYDGAGAKPSLLKGGYIQAGNEWKSGQEYSDGHHKLVDLGDAILVAAGKKGFYLLDNDLKELQKLEVPGLGKVKVGAYDSAAHMYYYVDSKNKKDLMGIEVSSTSLGQPKKIATATGNIENIGYHPKTNQVVVISETTSDKYIPLNERETKLGILSGNTFDYKDLPKPKDLFAKDLNGLDVIGTNTPYSMMLDHNDVPEFLPMNDGTFILSTSSDMRADTPDSQQLFKGILISIKPDAAGTDADPYAKPMEGSRTNNPELNDLLHIHSNGSLIVRFDKNEHKDYSFGQILKYTDRDVEKVSERLGVDQTGFTGWANVGFDNKGNAIIESGSEGKLTWYDSNKKELLKDTEVRLSRGRQTFEFPHGTFIVREDGTIIVPNYNKSDDTNEVYSLVKLVDSSKPPAVKESSDESALEKLKNKHDGSESGSSTGGFSWSSVLGKLSTVLSIMIAAFGIGSMLAKIFNIRIPGIR